ncbi:hypothetical protein [Yoonia sp.]|uniref:hypothetical protein n=1 Tax=Yoonia sp. TaxID=2212373 RepID=UPI0025D1AE46|nr:hypothetical protein [Yoonia sp.]
MRNLIAALVLVCAAPHTAIAQSSPDTVAPERITVRIVAGITSSRQLPSAALTRARTTLSQGGDVRSSQLRQLADLGDGFAALRFAQRLEQQNNGVPKSDIAHYYGMAAATGRGGSITGLIRMLDQLSASDLSASRALVLKNIMMSYALAGNSHAVDAVLRYQLRQQPFGPLEDELIVVLNTATGEGAAKMGLQIAMTILRNPDATTLDLLRAQQYLQLAATATSIETTLTAQNMLPLIEAKLQSRPDLARVTAERSADQVGTTLISPVARPSPQPEVTQ